LLKESLVSKVDRELLLDGRQDEHPLLKERLHFRVTLESDLQQVVGLIQLPRLNAGLVVLVDQKQHLASLQGGATTRVLKSVPGKGVSKESGLDTSDSARKFEVQARVALRVG